MLSRNGQFILFGLLTALGVAVFSLAVAILRRGKLYQRLNPHTRPRRWVLISVLALFFVFLLWFPVWITSPDTLPARFLTALFGVTFVVVGLTITWFAPLVDAYFMRKDWPLR